VPRAALRYSSVTLDHSIGRELAAPGHLAQSVAQRIVSSPPHTWDRVVKDVFDHSDTCRVAEREEGTRSWLERAGTDGVGGRPGEQPDQFSPVTLTSSRR
jgi:hypothetical protein